jgi:Fic/DOC family protein
VINEIIFTGDLPRQTISDRVRRGELRALTTGVYTTDMASTSETIVARYWHIIVGRLFPDAVITDRSALTGGKVGDYLYLAHNRRTREVELPGLIALARPGAGPLDDDILLPGGLFQASRGRALAENTRPSRSRGGRPRRTLDDDELASWIDRLCHYDGEEKLQQYRIRAEELATSVDAPADGMIRMSKLIGAALGSQKVKSANTALNARQHGIPFDPDRVIHLDRLAVALRSSATQSRTGLSAGSAAYGVQAFYEAYFSNYIEGTTFTVDEAKALVYDKIVPAGRNADGHDVIGTFQIVSDYEEMSRVAQTPDEFLELLRTRHAVLMAGRTEKDPGSFKLVPNQAGNTLFVDPALVEGTLREGFTRLAALDSAWERAVYTGFFVAEVHPFVDGNGRMARVMMNAELVSGGQSKIIVPTGFRRDYLTSLRRLSRDDDPSVFVKSMRFLHDYTQQIDWSTDESAVADLRSTNAFEEEGDAPRVALLRPADLHNLDRAVDSG